MAKDIDILGIGNAIMDIIAPVPDDFLSAQSIERGSMTLVDEPRALSLNGALQSVGELREIAGGSAANTMVGIAGLGVRAGYVGKIGKDGVGKRLIAGYREAGVQFETTPTTSGTASARCMIAVTPDGQRSMSTFLGANADFGVADISKDQIARAKTIYLEGYLFDSDDQKAAYVRAAELAQATGGQVALTLSDSFCVGRHRAGFRQLAEHQTDILFANEDELLALFETDRLDTALDALSGMRPVVCVTRGEKGSVIQTNERRHLVPAAPISQIVDTTGAGDQYAAGVLAGRAMGMDWGDAGYLGSLAASEVIQHYGARPETPIHKIATYGT
jgi:sugar/nucleoside kinase (ribokinase family)